MLTKICDTVAVLHCLSWRLFDITNEMLALAAAAASGFVSFSATLVFSAESQTVTFFPNAM